MPGPKYPTHNPAPSPAQVLLTEKDAAARLSLSTRTLQLWRRTGEGPSFIKMGAAVRYRPADVDAFLESSVRRSTSDQAA